ncbi:hypothetical protein BCR35DRAFT_289504 [Leucosporidium creatinivorum]|uniref:Fe2OG dioxygenase domain-containing protein n=1 Tax=Leucosporidium creatinivorum TaxID=106004 RepID=A0A1Y2FU12_9BASI|nr:hypothetical protein BCR35DRAFT_289504 [Leucosporidium creatinivorum]
MPSAEPNAGSAPRQLPLIDLSSFLTPASSASSRAAVAQEVHAACAKFGFLYITGLDSVVSRDEMNHALAEARSFFLDTPEREKELLKIKGDGARGWQKLGENVTQYKADHHEGLDLYRPVPNEDSTKLLHGPNQWPSSPPTFRSTMETWIEKMQVIGLALMEATAMGLGMDMEGEEWAELKGLVKESFWVMRCIGYPPLPENAPGVSCGAHKDYGCWTLLHADSTPGALQVFLQSPDGDSEENGARGTWLNADPIEGAFVVNVGEMWDVWTNGLYKATLHRVIHKGSNYRVSIPFFYEPNFDAVIKPLPSALALQAKTSSSAASQAFAPSVVYGEFLAKKVSGNFAES